MTELRGRRVVLRPLRFDDAAALRAIHVQPEVARWWGEMDDAFPFDEPGSTRLTIWVGEHVAGLIQFGEQDEPTYRYAWIDVFLDAAVHGQGLGADAVGTLLRHLVDERGHHRVTIESAVENAAAVRAYEKAGFRRIGVMRRAERGPEGRWRDALLMEHVVEPPPRSSPRDR